MGLAGQCRRYPQVITKAGSDWCGEHTVVMIQVPIVDMMTTGLDKPAEPKRRGRPPKVQNEATP